MDLQKKSELIEAYRTYQSTIHHPRKSIELQLMPDALEKHHDRNKTVK